jgi:hypothetical protein
MAPPETRHWPRAGAARAVAASGIWPVAGSGRSLPRTGPGSFWEDRGDRRHCGVDLYAPRGLDVVSIADGVVARAGVFTSPAMIPYWNTTYFILVEHAGVCTCYAELDSLGATTGDAISAGQAVGRIGCVLNTDAIGPGAPAYVRELKDRGLASMLHLEVYASPESFLLSDELYVGGNWFGREMPAGLLDPCDLLLGASADRIR